MVWQDMVNGAFEGIAAIFAWRNVIVLVEDKEVRGVSVAAWGLFAAWGVWNLYYYPHLDQWASFFGGLGIVTANLTWLVLALWYRR